MKGEEQAMPLPRFWDIVERCRSDDEEEFLEALRKELRRLPPDQILAFDARLEQLLAECYRRDVWGAAYCLQGGCSDDGFLYFRCWLISQGRHAYEAALANPDSLADYADEDDEARERELFLYAPVEAWQDVTGRSDRAWYKIRRSTGSATPAEPAGEAWDFEDEDEMRRRFPKLARRLFDDFED